jgi:putative membrane protein
MASASFFPVFAHIAGASGTGPLNWDWEWFAFALVAVALAVYTRGVVRLRRGRVVPEASKAWRVASFAAGAAVALLAVSGPLDSASAQSFAAHMLQHMLLMLVAAPLIVVALPLTPFLAGLPADMRVGFLRWRRRPRPRRFLRGAQQPAVTFPLYAALLLGWHVPAFYDAALRHGALHAVEHATLFAVAVLSWWTVLDPRRRAIQYGPAVLYVFALMLECTAIAGLFTLANKPLYGPYAASHPLGLTPLEDQQLGGVVMGSLAAVVYLGTGALLFLRWLGGAGHAGQAPAQLRLAPPIPPTTDRGLRNG